MHNLHMAPDGKAAMMYVGDPPWHGLGTQLDEPATSAAAINKECLDNWLSQQRGLRYPVAVSSPVTRSRSSQA